MTIKLNCIDCGKVFTTKSPKALRCEKCKHEHLLQMAKESHRKQVAKRNYEKRKRAKISIRQILREMEEYNKEHNTSLSYGQYVSLIDRGMY